MKMELASTLRSSSTSPSFPHAFSGNPGGIRTGPRLKHSGVTLLESYLSTPSQIFRTRQGSAVGRISLRLTRSLVKLISEISYLRALRALRGENLCRDCWCERFARHLRSIQIVDEAAIIDAPEIVEIPQRHRIGFFRGLVLFN